MDEARVVAGYRDALRRISEIDGGVCGLIATAALDAHDSSGAAEAVSDCDPPANIKVLPTGLVSRNDAARFLGVKPKTLAHWASEKKGPDARLVGSRRFYHINDLRTFAKGGA